MNQQHSELAENCSEAQTRYGAFWHFTQDDPIGKSLQVYGEWAETEIALLRSFLRAGDVVLDVGANVGTHTVPLSLAVGPAGHVVAFEPQPAVFALLEHNTRRNALDNVTLHRAVAGKDAGTSAMPRVDYAAHFNFGGVAATNDYDAARDDLVQVPRFSIDGLELARCDFLKIDAEGGEIDVLKGAQATLTRHRPALYLECNCIGKGLSVIQFLQLLGYRCFYSITAAFNPDNHHQVRENFFGLAHESSLLFVHASDDRLLDIASTLGLPEIESKSDLVESFVKTLRYGDVPDHPTQEYRQILARQPRAPRGSSRFSRPVAVIVPVYNAPDSLQSLIASLETAIPEPLSGLRFYFSDDCSPDPEVRQVFEAPFFSRSDVQWVRHPQNLGFVGNVNAAIAVLPPDADIVLLNSDTEVWDEIFTTMQAEAYSDPLVATVTPLTNNGTIASLFRFPEGSGMPEALSPALLSRAVRELDLALPDQPTPTAVGFCMYMKRAAIEAVGILDTTFGKGYGEECDWSRRASNKGWKHLITCKAFVQHEGTQSFDDTFKQQSLKTNSEILTQRYPDYDRSVVTYIERNPLKFERLVVVLAALKLQTEQPTYLMTLHGDPDSAAGGGTEKHVRGLQRQLDDRGHTVLELFPVEAQQFCLRIHRQGQVLLEERFAATTLPHLIPLLETYVDCLHVHHTLRWSDEALKALSSGNFSHKILSAHDYYLICPSINLLRLPGNVSFCGIEQDMEACNACLQQRQGFEDQVMARYRSKTLWFLEAFDTLLFPSEALREYFELAFGEPWKRLSERAKVLSHDLEHLWKLAPLESPAMVPDDKRIVFIGALGMHKGSTLLLEALPRLLELGFSVEILGILHPMPPEGLGDVRMTPYRTPQELKQLLDDRRPMIAAFPVVWAETFCYAFYEGLILSDTAVPVVGPFGNPANVTRREEIGLTMRGATAEDLVDACVLAAEQWKALHAKKTAFLEKLRHAQTPYYEAYRTVDNEIVRLVPAGRGRDRRVQDLQAVSKLDFLEPALQAADQDRAQLRTERESKALKVALKLQAKLRAYPRVTRVLLGTAQVGWKSVKKLKAMLGR